MRARFLLAASLTLAASTSLDRLHAEDRLKIEAERIFTLGAEPSAKAAHAVQTHYRGLPAAIRDAAAIRYAYAVVLIRQKRLGDAAGLLDQLAASRPDDDAVQRAKIWILLTLGERAKALGALEQWQKQWSRVADDWHPAPDRDPTSDTETAEFLGALSGFFAGPWHSRQREDDLKKRREELRLLFEGDAQAAFDHGEGQVLAHYLQLHGELQQASQKAREIAKKRTDQAQADLSQAEMKLNDEEQSLADKDAKRSDQTKAKLAEIDGKLEKLEQQHSDIVQQMVPLEQSREALVVQFLPEPPPGYRLFFQGGGAVQRQAAARANILSGANIRHNDGLRRLLAPIVGQLTLLMGQAAQVQDGIMELETERYSVAGRRQQDAAKIAGKKRDLDRRETRLKYASKHLNTGAAGNTVQVRAQTTRMSLFSTYVEFPFEREKQRVLGTLKP
jgi:hypothetical protein